MYSARTSTAFFHTDLFSSFVVLIFIFLWSHGGSVTSIYECPGWVLVGTLQYRKVPDILLAFVKNEQWWWCWRLMKMLMLMLSVGLCSNRGKWCWGAPPRPPLTIKLDTQRVLQARCQKRLFVFKIIVIICILCFLRCAASWKICPQKLQEISYLSADHKNGRIKSILEMFQDTRFLYSRQ